jgi:tetraacyldisaccharide 4'-kinase
MWAPATRQRLTLKMRAPDFWWRGESGAVRLLRPAAAIYGAIAARRLRQPGVRAPVPVVCVGDPTLGGAGKTPTALALAGLLADAGERPAFLTRGYGGRFVGPMLVDASEHGAADVGDEPLLLARAFPTIVARDRVAGARLAPEVGATVILMDDGFQNASLVKDCALLVVDAGRGVGNGLVFPAGPLRAPLADQLAQAHALLTIRPGDADRGLAAAARARGVVLFEARVEPEQEALEALRGKDVFAFAGIGHPRKFFEMLEQRGANVQAAASFADHHAYSERDAASLMADAAECGNLAPVTTEKDYVKLAGGPMREKLRAQTTTVPIRLVFNAPDAVRDFVLAQIRLRV